MRFDQFLKSSASESWVNRCRLLRDVAVGLYQRCTLGATHLGWDCQHLYLDAQGRAQLLPLVRETAMTEEQDVEMLGQLIWHIASCSPTLATDWQKGAGLPHTCPPALITLLQACTNPSISERPSLKALAKGLDAFWQRAEQGSSEASPLPLVLSPAEEKKKKHSSLPSSSTLIGHQQGDLYIASPLSEINQGTTPSTSGKIKPLIDNPEPLQSSTSPLSKTLSDSVLASGSLHWLLVDDQTVPWLNGNDPRYQLGVKLCALRDSFDPPQESKASLPALDQAIAQTLLGSAVEMLLWIAENEGDPNHSLAEIATKLWHRNWQAFRPGDPPPNSWLPLSITLDKSHHPSPVFIHHHPAPSD